MIRRFLESSQEKRVAGDVLSALIRPDDLWDSAPQVETSGRVSFSLPADGYFDWPAAPAGGAAFAPAAG